MTDLKAIFSGVNTLTKVELRKLQRKILDDTVAYYSEDTSRRSTFKGICYYRALDRCCAVGRLIHDEDYNPDLDKPDPKSDTDVKSVWSLLPEYVKKLPVTFLQQLQQFHDGDRFWDKNGLTSEGKEYLQEIIKFHKLHDN